MVSIRGSTIESCLVVSSIWALVHIDISVDNTGIWALQSDLSLLSIFSTTGCFCIQGFAVLHKLNLGIYLELSVTVFISMGYMVFVLQFPHKNQCVLKWCPCMFHTGDLHVSTLCSFSYAAIWPLQWCLDKWRLVLINAAFFNFSFEVKKFNINWPLHF